MPLVHDYGMADRTVFVMALSFLGVWEIPIPGIRRQQKGTRRPDGHPRGSGRRVCQGRVHDDSRDSLQRSVLDFRP